MSDEQTLNTMREALEFVKQNRETFWHWIKRNERPSEQLARIDAALTALEQAAPVSAWEPLADGEYTVNSSVQAGFKGDYLPATATIRKNQLSIAEGDWGYESIACNLPDDIRLCQRRPATAAGEEE